LEAPNGSGLRTLNACPSCARQYDVSHLVPGARARCVCGAQFAARFERPHSPRSLRCSSCGGDLALDASSCAWCGAAVTLEERKLSTICPTCFARVLDRARFCMECGIAIQPQALYALPDSAACPRCKGELRGRELSGTQVTECVACGGLWLTQDHFEELCESADARERVAAELRARPPVPDPTQGQPARYLPCVACKELMNRRNYASVSGVVIDVCRKHGVWLDTHELEKVLAFVRAGGLGRARQREIERLGEERRKQAAAAAWQHPPAPLPFDDLRRDRRANDLADWLVELVQRLWG
jgi:Zn-finger nucleic acid-binding protein